MNPNSSRLIITPWKEDHAAAFLELTRDEGFRAFPITDYRQTGLASARQWVGEMAALYERTGLGKWGVWERGTGELIGMGGLTPFEWEDEELIDITYRLRESAWGRGYGIELARALVQFARNKKLPQITATITPDNVASKVIAEKIGLQFDRHIILKNVPTDLYRLWL